MQKPLDIFDRDWEWGALTRFAEDARPGATLGVVPGRRRQGKSFLLQSLCEASGGFYYEAIQATEGDGLRPLGDQLGRPLGVPGRIALEDWNAAVDALLGLGRDAPRVVVLDELPYLVRGQPVLPSILQAALAPRGAGRVGSRPWLLLCGSALSFTGKLLAGDAPLRGRAGLDLVVPTLDFRQAATFSGLEADPELACLVHAVVGGTPAYRLEFVADDAPAGRDDFDAWVCRAALHPARPLFREGRDLLAEEPDLRDTALYHSLLAAIAEGESSRAAIAGALGRDRADRQGVEIDVVATGHASGATEKSILLMGEAQWGRMMDLPDLGRLVHARQLLADRGLADPSRCRLACFGAAGFSPALRDAGRRGEVVLVDPRRLYRGD